MTATQTPQDQLDALLDRLDADDDALTRPTPQRIVCIQPGDERKVQRFAQVTAFAVEHGRPPSATTRDAAERTLAASLRGFRSHQADVDLLRPYDDLALLTAFDKERPRTIDDILEGPHPLLDEPDPSLFAPLPDVPDAGANATAGDGRVAPDRIAERRRCLTFDVWRPVFARIAEDVNAGRRRVTPTGWTTAMEKGHAFITSGHVAVVAEINEVTDGVGGVQPRLRIIYDNGTESDHLLASFAKVLNADPDARRISFPDGAVGGLFDAAPLPVEGRIYVARTKSTDAQLAELAPHMLKIGRTGGDVERRLAGAANDPTFLHASVEIVATYAVRGFEVKDVEAALHAFFASAALRITVVDGSRTVDPREWFIVTPRVVDKAIQLVMDRRIKSHRYDVESNKIVEVG